MNKSDLRAELKHKLKELGADQIAKKSTDLSYNLNQFLIKHFSSEQTIGGFIPFGFEPLWFCEMKEKAKTAIVNIKSPDELSYHPVDLEKVKKMEPQFELPQEITLKVCEPEIVLVPGLGFTREGARLGRGKGYFDKFLSSFSGVSIGVCFEEQLVPNTYNEAHDRDVDFVITEKNIFKGKK